MTCKLFHYKQWLYIFQIENEKIVNFICFDWQWMYIFQIENEKIVNFICFDWQTGIKFNNWDAFVSLSLMS